jgi:hypothetical protein
MRLYVGRVLRHLLIGVIFALLETVIVSLIGLQGLRVVTEIAAQNNQN